MEIDEIVISRLVIIPKRNINRMIVGILTCARLPELLESDQKLIPLFSNENITAKAVIWDDESINWTEFDYLIFRNTWDYYQKEIAFNHWL
ncbi:MAG: hypothetical protein KA215_00855, partial [Flavobacterium sp.]|nr:hypothetical protein [Flavobacterium sp.]